MYLFATCRSQKNEVTCHLQQRVFLFQYLVSLLYASWYSYILIFFSVKLQTQPCIWPNVWQRHCIISFLIVCLELPFKHIRYFYLQIFYLLLCLLMFSEQILSWYLFLLSDSYIQKAIIHLSCLSFVVVFSLAVVWRKNTPYCREACQVLCLLDIPGKRAAGGGCHPICPKPVHSCLADLAFESFLFAYGISVSLSLIV